MIFISLFIGCGASQKKKDQDTKKKVDWQYQMGAAYFESHEIPLAIRALTQTLELDPKHEKANHLLGFIYMGRRDYTKAEKYFRKALEVNPKFHSARNNLGTLFLAMERWRDGIKEFESLIEEPLYPTPELAHNNMGWALLNLRKPRKAMEHFKLAIFLKPQMCLAHNNLGIVNETLGFGTDALHEWNEAVRLCPTNYAEPHFHLGKALQERGDPTARSHFERCSELEPMSNLGRRCREYLGAL